MRVNILQWSAWAPGLSTPEEWEEFFQGKRTLDKDGTPDVSHVPALLRRRMSRLSRMAVATAFDCCEQAKISPADARTVFASRHGEMTVTAEILEELSIKAPVSPTAFSGSVHHTALGYFSMASSNHQAMRAIAGGDASFGYGFLDAMGMLNDHNKPVLLIAADDELPEPFKTIGGPTLFPYAAAFLLTVGETGIGKTVSLEMAGRASTTPGNEDKTVQALNFLRWFLSGNKHLTQNLASRIWQWQK